MTEKILIRLDHQFRLEVESLDPETGEDFAPVYDITDLTPYGMLLAGLGSCTAMVVNTYADNHQIDLEAVELHLEYERVFDEDCENCENIDRYEEHIYERIEFFSDLSKEIEDKLLKIAHYCPIEKMMTQGIEIISEKG